MNSLSSFLLLLLLPALTVVGLSTTGAAITTITTVGVTYATPASAAGSSPISPDRIAAKVTSMRIPAVRILDSDPALIRSFAYTNVSLLLSVPNPLVPLLATNRSLAMRWVYRHVLPFHPRSRISMISVGDDIISYSPDISQFLLRAMQNVYQSLRDLSIYKVSVSTTFSFFNTISTTSAPSTARFQQPNGDFIISPVLQFLEMTNSSFLINIYPYNFYRSNFEIPIGFALFQEHPFLFRDDLTTGVRYRNIFDIMIDSVISAMAVMGHENLPVIVAETGWPCTGTDAREVDATVLYAEMYLKGLIKHLRSGNGTPLRKEGVAEAYIFELVGREQQGTRNWGILDQNMTQKYRFEFSNGCKTSRFRTYLIGLLLVVVVLRLLM
ncbi:PREDICTED: glucan endo-1,3-beta-glucosidase 2 [Tarenaya hassleriana]|uniref:glucan endo-1,3-beta-glucosidase 2 n=1 Tax=Tarenaya hassleriana TaxID=28532 RepID=UPI00053CA241|nr:PREDICTED: glucan endo-1,3-beta-glucosidase 2 [Tarenaya hassleriana]